MKDSYSKAIDFVSRFYDVSKEEVELYYMDEVESYLQLIDAGVTL